MPTVVHIVMFRFRPEVSQAHKDEFEANLKTLKHLSCVKDNRLIVGSPSITKPIERSQGYHYCLLSYHQGREALDEYQASEEHYKFDFEVEPEDEYMVGAMVKNMQGGVYTPNGSGRGSTASTASS